VTSFSSLRPKAGSSNASLTLLCTLILYRFQDKCQKQTQHTHTGVRGTTLYMYGYSLRNFAIAFIILCGCLTSSVVVTIPCDQAADTTTVLESHTTYVLEDCYVADLPPSSGGLLTPILHAFTGYRSPSNPTLVNVDVVVRHGNVVPIVHIESIIPGLAGVQVANIFVTVVGLRATWPVGTEQAVVDTIFSILEAPFVNVSLTLQNCVLNLSLSASASAWRRPVFVLLRPPPIPSLSSTNATLMILNSSIVTLYLQLDNCLPSHGVA
jgi:hypothetical protein